MKHALCTRCRFDNKELMDRYLVVSRDMLIPSLRAQTNKDFEWIVMVKKGDEDYIMDFLDMEFTPVYDNHDFIELLKTKEFVIQTRHDIDDWMAPKYIDEIQRVYKENINRKDKFLIQAQPIKLMYKTGEEIVMGRYHSLRTSMFLTLCQHKIDNYITEKKHGHMWKIAPDVYSVPDGLVKWVIHGNNIS